MRTYDDTAEERRRSWSARLPTRMGFASVLVLVGFAHGSRAVAQPTVLVRAESRIELRVERRDDATTVHGVLRDDLGEPLAARAIELRLRANDASIPPIRRGLTTDEGGRFETRVDVTTGGYRLSATFDGDETHERVEVARGIDLDRADVRVRVHVPEGDRFDLDQPRHAVTVRIESEAGVLGVQVTLLDELDRVIARGATNQAGELALDLASETLGAEGAGRIKARTEADALRAEAQTEVPVVRFRVTHLSLEADAMTASDNRDGRREATIAVGEPVRLSGLLEDSGGPIAGRAIGLFDGDAHLTTVLTDESGRYVADVGIAAEETRHMQIIARFSSDTPGRVSSESPPLALTIEVPSGPSVWWWLMLPTLLCALALTIIARRAPRAPERGTVAPPPPIAGVAPSARRALLGQRSQEVAGVVCDLHRDSPIAHVEVTLTSRDGTAHRVHTAANGSFAFRDLPAGMWQLHVLCEGYSAETSEIATPHRGEWIDFTVHLENRRDRAVAPFRRVALALLPSARLWSVLTNREVAERGRPGVRARLNVLSRQVDDVVYGAAPPSEADVAALEHEADEAMRDDG